MRSLVMKNWRCPDLMLPGPFAADGGEVVAAIAWVRWPVEW